MNVTITHAIRTLRPQDVSFFTTADNGVKETDGKNLVVFSVCPFAPFCAFFFGGSEILRQPEPSISPNLKSKSGASFPPICGLQSPSSGLGFVKNVYYPVKNKEDF